MHGRTKGAKASTACRTAGHSNALRILTRGDKVWVTVCARGNMQVAAAEEAKQGLQIQVKKATEEVRMFAVEWSSEWG